MSTRGYVTLIDQNKNILLSAFCPSSAYPSYFGLDVLDAVQNGSFPAFIQQVRAEYPEEIEMTDGISRDWYIKRPDNPNQYFQDYAYEYDPSAGVLNLYHFGTKALTIPAQDADLYRGIFALDHALSLRLCYDPVSCMPKKEYYTELRRMLRAGTTLTDFQQISKKPMLYMERYRMKGFGWNEEDFSKDVLDTESRQKLTFHASKNGNYYTLYIQTPFFRMPVVSRPLMTPTSVEKEIARMIRDEPEKIRSTMALYQKIEQYEHDVKAVFANSSISDTEKKTTAYSLLDTMTADLEQAQANGVILGSHVDSFKRLIGEQVYRKVYALDKAAASDKKPLDSVIANAQQEADMKDPGPDLPAVQKPVPERT